MFIVADLVSLSDTNREVNSDYELNKDIRFFRLLLGPFINGVVLKPASFSN